MSDEARAAVPEPDSEAQPDVGPSSEKPLISSSVSRPDRPAAAPPASTAPLSMPAVPRASYLFLGIVTFVSLALDLGTKAWAQRFFESPEQLPGHRVVLLERYLALIYAKNHGGAWGLLQHESEALRRPFFLVVSVVAIVFIVSLYRKLVPGQTALKWGLPLVLGGALGNLIDRIRFGYVVDFIDAFITYGDGSVWRWPTFNVADIAICVGVGLMAIDMFTSRKPAAATPSAQPAADGVAAAPVSIPSSTPAPQAPDLAGGFCVPSAEALKDVPTDAADASVDATPRPALGDGDIEQLDDDQQPPSLSDDAPSPPALEDDDQAAPS